VAVGAVVVGAVATSSSVAVQSPRVLHPAGGDATRSLVTVHPPDLLLADEFADPPMWARPQAYWIADAQLDVAEATRQIEGFRQAGLGGITYEYGAFGGQALAGPHVGGDQPDGHLSDAWFIYLEGVLDALAERDMTMYAIDVPFTPSGSAGGQVAEPARGGDPDLGWTTLVEVVPATQYEVVTRPYWIDVMNPAAVARYLELAYQPYVDHVPDHLGTTLQALWSDEVAFHPTATEPTFKAFPPRFPEIPWTPGFDAWFADRYGYELTPEKLDLIFQYRPDLPESRRVAHDYWEAASLRFAETYYGGLSAWANDHGIGSIGQLLGEETTEQHWVTEASYYRAASQSTVASTDLILGNIDVADTPFCDGQSCYGMTMKFISSAAHLFDRGRVHIEFLDVASAEVKERPSMLRSMIDHAFVRGVNNLAMHAYNHNGDGYGENNPLFHRQRIINDYIGRLSYLLSGGHTLPDLAIAYAPETYWVGDVWNRHTVARTAAVIGSDWEYDVVPVELLEDPQTGISGGVLRYGPQSYRGIVLPDWPAASLEVLQRLEAYVMGGGTVAVVGRVPVWETRGRDDELRDVATRLFGFDPATPPPTFTSTQRGAGRVMWLPLHTNAEMERSTPLDVAMYAPLVDALRTAVVPRAMIHGGADLPSGHASIEVLPYRRAGDDVYFVANFPDWVDKFPARPGAHPWDFVGRDQAVVLDVPNTGVPQAWDAQTGEVRRLWHYDVVGDRIRIPLDVPAYGSVAIRLDPTVDAALAPHVTATNLVDVVVAANGTVIGHLPPGVGSIATATVATGASLRTLTATVTGPRTTDLSQFVWDLEWPDGGTAQRRQGSWYDPAVDPLYLPRTPWYRDGGTYRGTVTVPAVAGRRIVVDLGRVGDVGTLTVNGTQVGTRMFPPYAWDVTDLVSAGQNQLELLVETSRAAELGGDAQWPSGLLGPARIIDMPAVTLRPPNIRL